MTFYGLNESPASIDSLYWHFVKKTCRKTKLGIHKFDDKSMSGSARQKKAGHYKDEYKGVRSVKPNDRPENWIRKRV